MDRTSLRWIALLWPPVLAGLIAVAAVAGPGDGWRWAGPLVLMIAGAGIVLAVLWLRQRPIAPGDDATYRTTALIKLSLAEGMGWLGFALGMGAGPWWLTAVGAGPSLLALWLAWPSHADRERHELLYLI